MVEQDTTHKLFGKKPYRAGCQYKLVTVCTYKSPGNYMGQFKQNVTPRLGE
ncbi:hypothetical protein B4U80_03771 [Leptotrombidium deliense]|uniref:Uncharacterized protein n=1 Tax=Leptotrombidium deliense TaxID=299467 RepID=A0A443QCK0_9ACAR|nr:hypothetical protein B4U80_03771 [Leptotrombidium deliense]